ncbi:branched-chain amino acid aminotransferase [Pendulispora brunnea]|uniref:Branched-chain-amino-acid aminotransferase n=1 Tax=Pendulispora brunnea TaxID=2905690 RepID=A0ABZ2K0N7_9BACT
MSAFGAVDVRVERISASRLPSFDLGASVFGSEMSDHMLVADFARGAWGEARIVPHGPMPLVPGISALQYGLSVFEGMKAHRSPSGEVLLFRPELNAQRLVRSAERLALPPLPPERFLAWLRALLDIDAAWVPPGDRGALYIRPCLFSIDASIRVKPAEACRFVMFTFPFANYYSASIDVYATERYVRAFPGGTGDIKPAGNYAAALLAEREAAAAGCQSALWLDGLTRTQVEECGVMNVFFVIDGQVFTPPLGGTILPGVTRDSVITLLRDQGVTVHEVALSIEEVARAFDRGALEECFGTGTAATVSHIRRIRWRDRDFILPPVEQRRIAPKVKESLVAIMTGKARDPHEWVVRLE